MQFIMGSQITKQGEVSILMAKGDTKAVNRTGHGE